MQIIQGTLDFNLNGEFCVAIGKFDGIHKGHQYLIDSIMEYKKDGCQVAVLTFDPSPAAFFSKDIYKGLTTKYEKRHIFEKIGVDVLVEYPLNKESASLSPEEFVNKILINNMNTRCVVCGPDFTFGDKGCGNVETLIAIGRNKGFEVKVCDKVRMHNEVISSSLIREMIYKGDMEKAAQCIGAPYSITGIVTKGRQIGRTIGLPTVNIIPDEDKLLPPYGVYAAMISYKDRHFKGITNVGVKPTVTDDNKPVVETFIFDFSEYIYGEYITVNLLRMVRPEKSFESVQTLKQQIESDIQSVKNDEWLI